MFIEALFNMLPEKWEQPKHASTDLWVNKIWYIHTMEYYLAIKTNKVLLHVITCNMNLENIMLSENNDKRPHNL